MRESIPPAAPPAAALPAQKEPLAERPEWVADSQLDKQEKYNAEKEAAKFHQELSQVSIEGGEDGGGYTRDRKSKLARNLVSRGNVAV